MFSFFVNVLHVVGRTTAGLLSGPSSARYGDANVLVRSSFAFSFSCQEQ